MPRRCAASISIVPRRSRVPDGGILSRRRIDGRQALHSCGAEQPRLGGSRRRLSASPRSGIRFTSRMPQPPWPGRSRTSSRMAATRTKSSSRASRPEGISPRWSGWTKLSGQTRHRRQSNRRPHPVTGQMITHQTVRKEQGIEPSRFRPTIDEFAPLYHVRQTRRPRCASPAAGRSTCSCARGKLVLRLHDEARRPQSRQAHRNRRRRSRPLRCRLLAARHDLYRGSTPRWQQPSKRRLHRDPDLDRTRRRWFCQQRDRR